MDERHLKTAGSRGAEDARHGRRLILVDLENLLGGSAAGASQVRDILHRLREAVGVTERDVMKIACGPRLLTSAMTALGNGVLLGRGVDGADRRLVDVLESEPTGRFASVVLASGDAAAFAEPIRRLAERGTPTDVWVGRGHLGSALRLIARSVTHLPEGHTGAPVLAA